MPIEQKEYRTVLLELNEENVDQVSDEALAAWARKNYAVIRNALKYATRNDHIIEAEQDPANVETSEDEEDEGSAADAVE